MKFSQLSRTLAAAERFLDRSLASGDRVALVTTSGTVELDFTGNSAKLHAAFLRLQKYDPLAVRPNLCPPLTDYQAFLIVTRNYQGPSGVSAPPSVGQGGQGPPTVSDQTGPAQSQADNGALAIATQEVINCLCGGNPNTCPDPEKYAQNAALADWQAAEVKIHAEVVDLNSLVERLETVPGERSIVFISPGFIWWTQKEEIDDIIDRALRANVTINSLDARGLWALAPGGNASTSGAGLSGILAGKMDALLLGSRMMDSGVLESVAEGTGGVWFHDNNDINEGFTETGGLPQTTYVLAFSPSDLAANGKYHKLKVKLASGVAHRGWTIQARKGYYAPSAQLTRAEQIRRQVMDAVFSQTEVADLPIKVGTNSAKLGATLSQLTVTTKLQASALHFNARAGKNADKITFVTAVFDINGKFMGGKQRTVQFTLTDPSLKEVQARGLMVPMRFKLTSGTYLVRVVVRDSDGALAAQAIKAVIPPSNS